MLTESGCLSRRRRLWDAVPENVDWLLVADPRHVQYLCNFWVQPLSFSGGERAWLLLEREGAASLLADNFVIRSGVHEPYVDREVVEDWYDHRHSVVNRDHALLAALRRVAGELADRPGLTETEWVPIAAANVLRAAAGPDSSADTLAAEQGTSLGTLLRTLRRRKEPDEVALLQECMRAGEAGQARLRQIIRPGIDEFEIYREVQRAAIAVAGRPALVYGDFRATNATQPKSGGLPTEYRLCDGDLFILDYSVVIDGYRSDFTNTMAVGPPRQEIIRLFRACQSAMEGGEQVLRAGVGAAEVHAAVAAPLWAEEGGRTFTHHAGHGLGLAHPEPPILVPESTDRLEAGDVITLEPGVYVPGVGGMRIEHNYLITDSGYERLSHHEITL